MRRLRLAAIFIYQDNKFVFVNPSVESITGYGHDELFAMSPLGVIHPDYRDQVGRRVLLRSQGVLPQSRHEVKIITKSGSERWMDSSSVLISYDNKPAGLVVAFDIT